MGGILPQNITRVHGLIALRDPASWHRDIDGSGGCSCSKTEIQRLRFRDNAAKLCHDGLKETLGMTLTMIAIVDIIIIVVGAVAGSVIVVVAVSILLIVVCFVVGVIGIECLYTDIAVACNCNCD